jgi:cell division protein FtsB
VNLNPRDITGRVLGKPLRSPYGYGGAPSRVRWLWLLPAAWLLWAGVISDHSLWRISRLQHELSNARTELQRVNSETARLSARLADPREKSEHAEAMLRAQGMAKPGEIIYRFDDNAKPVEPAKPAK